MRLPESIRPYASAIAKYHFWLLSALVPLLVLPMLGIASSDLGRKIDSEKSNISSKMSAVKAVRDTNPHPNTTWAQAIDVQTKAIRQDTWRTWKKAYVEQQAIQMWPSELGEAFLKAVQRLDAGKELPRQLRELYQNSIPAIVRTLPARMNAADMMDPSAGITGMSGGADASLMLPGGLRAGNRSRRQSRSSRRSGPQGAGQPDDPIVPLVKVQWNQTDQKRIYDSFVWSETPSTTQILLAQEELWVYGILCDAIARANGESSAYDAVISFVERLAIGYEAAEDQPGGEGSGRIMTFSDPAAAGMASMDADFEMDRGSADLSTEMGGSLDTGLKRPSHPRFSGIGLASGGGGGGGDDRRSIGMSRMDGNLDEAAMGGSMSDEASGDDALYNWIYVDFDGIPLTKSEIDGSPTNRIVRFVPFVLRIRIKEQRLDDFLVQLATQPPVPIDVRQVRINPDAATSSPMAGGGGSGSAVANMARSFGFGGRTGGGGSRRSDDSEDQSDSGLGGLLGLGTAGPSASQRVPDLDVELRGSIALVVAPSAEVIGLTNDDLPADDEPPVGNPVEDDAANREPQPVARPANDDDPAAEGEAS